MSRQILPFNFRELPSGQLVISNLAGFHQVLDNRERLIRVINEGDAGDDHINRQLEQGLFLVDTDQYEGAVSMLASAYTYRQQLPITKPYLFMVVPTLRCDHDCTYCQVSRAQEYDYRYDLPLSAIPATLDLIHRVGTPPYKIEFQGGEPLLRMDFIQEFVSQLNSNYDIDEVEIVIASSLSLFNDEILYWAKSLPVH